MIGNGCLILNVSVLFIGVSGSVCVDGSGYGVEDGFGVGILDGFGGN